MVVSTDLDVEELVLCGVVVVGVSSLGVGLWFLCCVYGLWVVRRWVLVPLIIWLQVESGSVQCALWEAGGFLGGLVVGLAQGSLLGPGSDV